MEDFEENKDHEDDLRLAAYIAMGVVEVSGMSEDGELIFEIKESAKELAPLLWKSHEEYVDRMLVGLYEDGYIEVEYDDNLEANISMSKEGFFRAKQMGIIPLDVQDIPNN